MPDLGKYADAVLSAYAVTLILILGLVIQTVLRGRKVRAEMKAVEQQAGQRDG